MLCQNCVIFQHLDINVCWKHRSIYSRISTLKLTMSTFSILVMEVDWSLTSQAYERVILSAFHSMLVVKFAWMSSNVKMGFHCKILKHRWATLTNKKNGHEWSFGLLEYNSWRKQCTRKCHVLSPKFTFDPSNSLEKWVECLCEPLDANNSIVEHLH
jgi:hypothetical protein